MGCNNDFDRCGRNRHDDFDRRDDWDDHGTRRDHMHHRRRRPRRGPEFGIFFGFPRFF